MGSILPEDIRRLNRQQLLNDTDATGKRSRTTSARHTVYQNPGNIGLKQRLHFNSRPPNQMINFNSCPPVGVNNLPVAFAIDRYGEPGTKRDYDF